MKAIALCFNLPDMRSGAWRDPNFGKRFPGAGWMKHLVDQGARVMAGESVMEHIKAMALAPSEVIVIQEERNGIGQDLVGMGADARVLMCLESPIFTPHFYDNVPTNFKHRLLFDGGTEHLYFPSFDDEDLKDPVPWNERKFLCMVTANKHYSMLPKTDSPSFAKAMETQLHDYRYNAIHHFLWDHSEFDLYGRGWGYPAFTVPSHFKASECDDKLATIRNYKFALCFENGSYPGYVTEKIIDCLVAGVVPVYMGAPDIERWIPQNLYLDARRWTSFEEMENFLKHYVGIDPEAKVAAGQQWVKSSPYNNRVFAKRILEMCE